MQAFTEFTGKVVPLEQANIDTDQIIPKQFLKLLSKTGYGKFLFYDWRYLPGDKPNPEFILNQPQYSGAQILVAGANFGCGSSREHAPWALLDYGFKVIISSSFADIFYNNCFKNGILPVVVSLKQQQQLLDLAKEVPNFSLKADLNKQELSAPQLDTISFDIEPLRKEFLLKGLDDIGWTLEWEQNIQQFEEQQKANLPWLWSNS